LQLALVILTVFFSVSKLAIQLPTCMAEATQQAAADSGTETSTSTTELAIQLGPIARRWPIADLVKESFFRWKYPSLGV